ncbi:MAG: hypothetical protein LC114_13235 [Bryobacterales bacterium]|nr:hypothetical protein [Bryobacterales bacterium]
MKLALVIGSILAFVSLASAQASEDRIVFRKVFVGSSPEYQEIRVDRSGSGEYKEAQDDPDPVIFELNKSTTGELFQLAESVDYFNRKLESGVATARMGEKTFRFEGSRTGSQTFNYSADPAAQKLQEYFEKIGESQRLFLKLEYCVRFDRLGVYDTLLTIDQSRARGRLVGAEHYVPLLEKIAKDQRFMNVARGKARNLADALREPARSAAP